MSSTESAPEDTAPALAMVWPGTPFPLGATYDGAGTNFSLFSEIAEKVELCLIASPPHGFSELLRRAMFLFSRSPW